MHNTVILKPVYQKPNKTHIFETVYLVGGLLILGPYENAQLSPKTLLSIKNCKRTRRYWHFNKHVPETPVFLIVFAQNLQKHQAF